MDMKRLCALIAAREILQDALREFGQHESDRVDARNCGGWTNEFYEPADYVCGACVLEAALRHNMRERAKVQGVGLEVIMVQDLGVMLPRSVRSAA
jgi:hypothetical protein